MRHHSISNNAERQQKLLDAFKTAAFGDFCRTQAFIGMDADEQIPQSLHMEAIAQPDDKWSLVYVSAKPTRDGKGIFEQIDEAEDNLSFFDAIKTLSEFERSQSEFGYSVADGQSDVDLGDVYFQRFAMREAIAFDAETGKPVPTVSGRITTSGVYTSEMREAVLNAWNTKRSLFKLPEFDLKRRLRTLDNGLSESELKRYLKTKECFPDYIRLFEKFLDKYREAAKTNYKRSSDIREIEDIHTEIEKLVDERFPEHSFPSKKDMRVNLAKTYVYFTIQQLQANYKTAREQDNSSSEYLEKKVLPKLEKLKNYYEKEIGGSFYKPAELAQLIMRDNFSIEGTPPTDILENYSVLKQWHASMEAGAEILPDAELPSTLPMSQYIPIDMNTGKLKTKIQSTKVAEHIIDISTALNNLIDAYTLWLASGCKDKDLFQKMGGYEDSNQEHVDGLHDKLEKLIMTMPKNDLVDRDNMIDLCVRFWMTAELLKLKADHGEVNDAVKSRLATVQTYHKNSLSEKSKNRSQTSKFRE